VTAREGGTLDLPLRLRRAGAAVAYILLSVPLGVVAAAGVLAVVVGAAVGFVWAGGPLLPGALAACRRIAERERRAANRFLDAHIPPLPARRDPRTWPERRSPEAISDPHVRRMLWLLAIKLPVAAATLALAAGFAIATGGLLLLGLSGITGVGATTYLGPVMTDLLGGAALCLLAIPVAVVAVASLGAIGSLLRSLTRALLLAPSAPEGGPVREMLAESLGDRTLSIAYWLPDREIFVDDAGRTVALPQAGSGRAWTAVERDGRRVAAILHDAELDTGPELVNAAAAAAALALDNERLKADLRARVEELRVSRVRIVEAADAARRRLERDLHDGAQQHLVSLALDLRLLKARLPDAEAATVVGELSDKLTLALAELRELARGIHPAVLTDRGLGPAVEGLAHRASVPVDWRVDVGEERLAPPIEAAAYFVVSEALTNVARYAQASAARVDIRRERDEVVVDVHDDGVGGADIGAGTGLRGLADRIAALDGTLRVDSPRGGGTRITARIPCAAGARVAEARRSDGRAPADAPPRPMLEAPP
jgi:signal transduction histidine kinase